MPRRVDRESRRGVLLDAAARVLVRDGLEGLTTRAVTDEAGEAKGILSHYFADKAELVAELVRRHHRRVAGRMVDALSEDPGIEGLRAAMLEALPLDDERLADAIVEVAFAAAAVADPARREPFRAERRLLLAVLAQRLRELADEGVLRPDLDCEAAAAELVTLMDGLSLQATLLDPASHRPAQIAQLDAALDRMRATAVDRMRSTGP